MPSGSGSSTRSCRPTSWRRQAHAWAERLATGPTKAIAITKWLLNRSLDTDRAGAFDDEAWGQELINRTEDAAEGVAAFVERRDVQFKGW